MKRLSKKYEIQASAKEVLDALTREDLIQEWSESPAEMNTEPGGKFSFWGGDIHGINLEVTDSKIVQDWKEKDWDKYSRVTFHINEENGITILEMIHEGIPESAYKNINTGWDEYFLGPLQALVEESHHEVETNDEW